MKPSTPPPPPPGYCPPFYGNAMPHILHYYIGRYLYVWLYEKQGLWLFPTFVDCDDVGGYAHVEGAWEPCRIPWRLIESIY